MHECKNAAAIMFVAPYRPYILGRRQSVFIDVFSASIHLIARYLPYLVQGFPDYMLSAIACKFINCHKYRMSINALTRNADIDD